MTSTGQVVRDRQRLQRRSAWRRRWSAAAAAAVAAVATGTALCSSAVASPSTQASVQASRTGTVEKEGSFDLTWSDPRNGVGNATIGVGSFKPPTTGTCLLTGNIWMAFRSPTGSGVLGYVVGYLSASGGGSGEVANTGSRVPLYSSAVNRGGATELEWPVSGTVSVNRNRPVTLEFHLGGYVIPTDDIHYVSTLAYSCP